MKIITNNAEETMQSGKRLAQLLRPGDFVALVGIFGAGKTYLTKGIAQGLGVPIKQVVTSPSFVLCNVYQGRRNIRLMHFDAQRLDKPQELFRLGLDDMDNAVCVMEWGDRILPLMKNISRLIRVDFKIMGQKQRLLEIFVRNHW